MQLNYLFQVLIAATMPVSFLVTAPVAATPLPNPNANCTCNPNDSFEPRARMPKGPFKGQCINSCEQRSVKLLLSAAAAHYEPSPGMQVVANVSHGGNFWVAKIPPNAIEDVIFQIEHFPAVVPAAHTQLRFRFKPGSEVILVSQAMAASTQVGIKDLVYSVEAVGIPEGRFNLFAGFFDRFALAYRLVSLQDRAEQMLVKDQHRVEQLKLNLTAEAKQQLLRKVILMSDRAGMRQMYDTFAKNCTTELFHAIDQSIQYDGTRRQPRMNQESFGNMPTGSFISRLLQNKIFSFETLNRQFSSLLTHIPTVSKAALKRRGLIAPNGQSQMPTLNDESKIINRVIAD